MERQFRALVNLLADCQLEVVDEIFRKGPAESGEHVSVGRRWAGGFVDREDPRIGFEPISFSSIPDFSAVISKWFSEYPRLSSTANLYLFGKHNSYLDSDNAFLGVMQALEAFHRTFHPGAFMPEELYKLEIRKSLFDAIPAATPEGLKDRLKSSIKYGYEFSLLRRLEELTDVLPKDCVFDTVRDKKFRVRSKDTRNSITHQIPNPEHPPMNDGELYSATLRWREVLFALILQRLNIPDILIVKAVKCLKRSEGTYIPY